jgi:peroxiredoxin Q/BCP
MKPAPDFILTDQYGQLHSLSDYRGSWVVLYFYPKDDTPGCTKEARSFQGVRELFAAKGAVVLGVSADSSASHKKFAEKYGLTFVLLSDPEKTVIRAYGAWGPKRSMGKEHEGILRSTFLIAPTGEIAREYLGVTPAEHGQEVLRDLEDLVGKDSHAVG